MNIPLLEPGEEKPLEWDATGLFMWSPTMDVFAVSHTSQIFVIRLLSWERIWTISTEDWGAKVTCLAWKPDGASGDPGSHGPIDKVCGVQAGSWQRDAVMG